MVTILCSGSSETEIQLRISLWHTFSGPTGTHNQEGGYHTAGPPEAHLGLSHSWVRSSSANPWSLCCTWIIREGQAQNANRIQSNTRPRYLGFKPCSGHRACLNLQHPHYSPWRKTVFWPIFINEKIEAQCLSQRQGHRVCKRGRVWMLIQTVSGAGKGNDFYLSVGANG